MRRVDLRSESGFTLVEMLVAAIVVVLGLGATLTVLNAAGDSGKTAERQQGGVALAQQEVETVRALPYNQVGMSSTTWPAAGGVTDNPAARYAGGKLRPFNDSFNENPVLAADCVAASTTCQVAPYSTTTLGSGGSATQAKIYRFVSWRDEECPIGIATNSGLLDGLIGTSGLANQVGILLAGLGGPSGSLQTLLNSISASGTNLTGLTGFLGGLITPVLNTAITNIKSIGNTLSPLTTQLKTALDPLIGASALTGNLQRVRNLAALDLCDMDLSAIKRLKTLKGLLADLQPSLQGVNGGLPGVISNFNQAASASCGALGALGCILGNILGPVLTPVSTALTNLVPGGSGLQAQINKLLPGGSSYQTLQDITSLSATLGAALDGLTNNTDKNTKRVQVAVILDPAGPAGPLEPIWVSTVVTDPRAGLVMP